jgi:hypothetical protein
LPGVAGLPAGHEIIAVKEFNVTTYSFSTISDPNAGSEGTIVTCVNASGEIAGDYYDSGGTDHGFTYSNGSFTDFSDLPGAPRAETDIGIVAGINDSGEVAGYYYTIPGITFLDDEGFVDNNGSYSYFSISGPREGRSRACGRRSGQRLEAAA